MDGWMDALQLGAGGWGACMMDAHGHGHAHAPPCWLAREKARRIDRTHMLSYAYTERKIMLGCREIAK